MNLAFATVAELAALVRSKETSPVELTQFFLERLERLGPRYNAVASLTRERALREARRAEEELRQGRDRGALHGIPYGAKDLLAARGAPTTWGAPPFAGQTFSFDATVVRRLARAGAVLAAKLAMIELAGGGGYGSAGASLQGPTRNPWHPEYWAGGSSSGSGAAVAAGLVPFAIGSETNGSIMGPASFCGITGLRPTYGLVSRYGAMPLSWTLDKLGPMARSAEDCGLVLQAIAGGDARDVGSARRSFRFRPSVADVRTWRIGYAPADFEELAPEEARPAFAGALQALRSLGASLIELSLPDDLPYGAAINMIIGSEAASVFGEFIEGPMLEALADERQKAGLRAYFTISARDYLDAMRVRRRVQEAFRALFRRVDVLVGASRLPPRIDEPLGARARRSPSAETQRPHNTALVAASNLAGLPALCLPCGFTNAGLPVAIQLVGRPFEEARLLALGMAYQAATDWHRRVPSVRETAAEGGG